MANSEQFSFWQLIKYIFNFISSYFDKKAKEEEKNRLAKELKEKLAKDHLKQEYSKIDQNKEEKKKDELENRLGNMF